jgi:hypothetical protein
MNLFYKEFDSLTNKDNVNLIIYFPDKLLDWMAEIEEVPVKLLDIN